MIGYIIGEVTAKYLDKLILECNGIGYLLMASGFTLKECNIGDTTKLFTKMIVREDDLSLIGFFEQEEEKAYEFLVTVSKVGPKLALSILSTYPVNTLYSYITTSNITALSKVSGLGKKTAERIVLELKDKIDKVFVYEEEVLQEPMDKFLEEDAIEALMSLGFSRQEAIKAGKEVRVLYPDASVDEMIKRSLSFLG
ncbi:MAG: Holliday junction branch migration protein RuvA [Filifactoraceae bacterium]